MASTNPVLPKTNLQECHDKRTTDSSRYIREVCEPTRQRKQTANSVNIDTQTPKCITTRFKIVDENIHTHTYMYIQYLKGVLIVNK